VLGLEREPQDVLVGEQLAQVKRIGGLLVDLSGARRDALLGDLADRVAEVQVLLRDRVQLRQRRHGPFDPTSPAAPAARARDRRRRRATGRVYSPAGWRTM
jgi:hypothetical protein